MIIKKGRVSWFFIFFVIFCLTIVFGINLFVQKRLIRELALLNASIERKIITETISREVVMPTEINRNFLNQVNKCFIPTANLYGYTLRITSGFRSLDEQDQIYSQGRVENGSIVSWAVPGKSMHNYGYAVDVVDRWRGYYVNWKRLGRIANFCGLEQVDDPHFEYRGGLSTEQFEDGLTPGLLTLPCEIMNQRGMDNHKLLIEDLESCGAPNFWGSI